MIEYLNEFRQSIDLQRILNLYEIKEGTFYFNLSLVRLEKYEDVDND